VALAALFPTPAPNKVSPCSRAFCAAHAPCTSTSPSCALSFTCELCWATHEDLRRKIEQIEKRYDGKFSAVFATLKQMLEVSIPGKKEIGFHAKSAVQKYPH
jgi:hypothetical protein